MDINLSYQGGSGGFFVLHLLLLAGHHKCKFLKKNDQEFSKIFHHQWNILDQINWKKQEIWPDNNGTLTSNFSNKIYFLCNPELADVASFPGKRIMVYTDIETQFTLAITKKAHWFWDRSISSYQREQFVVLYYKIKANDWPDVTTTEDFYTLPKHIQTECLEQFNFNSLLDLSCFKELFKLNVSKPYGNERIDSSISLDNVDIFIKLQDIIRTKGEAVYSPLGLTRSDASDEFIANYLDLHSNEQKLLLLN